MKISTGFFGTLFLVLLVLRITGLAMISYWWVFAPLYVPFIAFIIVCCLFGAFFFKNWKS